MKSSGQSKYGFTLIEILVVLGIVAMLMAMIIPIIGQVRARAKETNCISNLRQISTSISLYASDYDQHFPCASINTSYIWPYSLTPYTKNNDIFYCASTDISHVNNMLPNGRSFPSGINYIYNIHIGGYEGLLTLNTDKTVRNLMLSEVVNPTATVMITDGSSTAEMKIPALQWKPKSTTPMSSVFLADAYYNGVVDPHAAGPGAPLSRHNGVTPVLYADGHVKTKRIEDFYNSPETREVRGKQAGYSPCLDPRSGCLK